MSQMFRMAHDTLGEVKVPKEAYYGAQTARAVENFPISGQRLPRSFIRAQGLIKASAAKANLDTGMLDERVAKAIIKASEEVLEGKLDDHFVVDAYQAGAGTSQNMNANEVIAHRATQLLGGESGETSVVHPNDHVNMAQSTNDTIHVAINIAIAEQLIYKLFPAVERNIVVLREKANEFNDIIKSGRTHLQDAVPIRVGQAFAGYAQSIENALEGIKTTVDFLYEIGLGGNAVGTGINAHPEYTERAISEIARRTKLPFRDPKNRFSFMQNTGAAIRVSNGLKELAIHMIKISSDLRLLSSGPRTGIAEVILPAVQPGSSIMPGKVNPVIPENLYMICSQVIGNDTTVTTAGIGSQLEINAMMPVIGYNVLTSITMLANGIGIFTEKCLKGMQIDRHRTTLLMEQSLALATVLNPIIGYEKAAEVAQLSYETGKTVREIVLQEKILTPEEAEELLAPEKMVQNEHLES